MSKVFTIIVTYNGMKWIEECLNSVVNSSIPISIIVVDNCSDDGTVSFIKEKFREVILLEQKDNLGFGKGNNLGISYALNNKADYVFLLNQDAFLEEYTVENLIKVSKELPQYGILSPIQLEYSGKFLEYYFFAFMAEHNNGTFYSDYVLKKNLNKIYDTNFIQAAAWLLPKNAIERVGGFDPIFYHYGEDNNYCQRILYHKLKIGVVPDTFIRHDSHKPKKAQLPIFSKKYFENYKKEIYLKYADINKSFGDDEIKRELKKIYKLAIKDLIQLNFKKSICYQNQAKLFKSEIEIINASRLKNQSKDNKFNYLSKD